MSDTLINIDRSQDGVAVLSMQRAEKRNALNIPLLQQMVDAIELVGKDTTCRVLILRGEGSVFCAGLDLIEAADPSVIEKSAESVRRLLSNIRKSRLIVIGAAVGAAYAGGAGILAACDLVVAADDLKIGFPEVRRGLVAAIVWGVLARKVRDGDMRELLLVAEPITAARAQQMGLVQWIVPSDRVLEYALDVARKVLLGGPVAVRETKYLLNQDPGAVDFALLQALHENVRDGSEGAKVWRLSVIDENRTGARIPEEVSSHD